MSEEKLDWAIQQVERTLEKIWKNFAKIQNVN
jgi:hypothetical protein